jgi:hypothetical protein
MVLENFFASFIESHKKRYSFEQKLIKVAIVMQKEIEYE